MLNSKNVHTLSANTLEDSIYSHCLYNTAQIEIQQLHSSFVLFKQLFTQLSNILNTLPMNAENAQFVDIAKDLLLLKHEHKYLEHSDG